MIAILCIFIYLLGVFIGCVLVRRHELAHPEDRYHEDNYFPVFLWPALLPLGLLALIVMPFMWAGDKIAHWLNDSNPPTKGFFKK